MHAKTLPLVIALIAGSMRVYQGRNAQSRPWPTVDMPQAFSKRILFII